MKSLDELDIFYQPPAEIRVHKDTCYTITPIGGAEELKVWREQQELKLAAQRKAQVEAYTLKRSFLADISKGEATASEEALREPPTLARFRQQYNCPSKSVLTELNPKQLAKVLDDETPKKPAWWERIFKRGV